jgi:hypothetical protein
MRWRYMYPQAEYPYARLLDENRARGKEDPEFELIDTGIFDGGRYWEITADYAKASPEELLIRLTVRNAGPEPATLDLLPTLWFRNTWSWGIDPYRPSIGLRDGALVAEHRELGARILTGSGAATVNPQLTGTKAAFRYRLEVAADESATVELRLAQDGGLEPATFASTIDTRAREAGQFYAELTRPTRATTRRSCFARRSAGCCGASSSTTTTCSAGSTAIPPRRPLRTLAGPAATTIGRT